MNVKGILALSACMMLQLPTFAQEPLPEEIMRKISYGTGMNIANQISQNPNLNQAELLKGFEAAIAQNLDTDKIAYAEGAGIATQVARRGMMPEEVLKAIQDNAAGNPPPYTEEEMIAANQEAQRFLQERQQQQMQASQQAAQQNLEKGQAFLAENAGKEGVMTTLSGLQYQVLEKGEGDKPAETSTVKVHYTGKLLDGTVFDSSVQRGEPVEFPLNQVIPGWTEGLQLMSPGAKYRFWIPSALAYGTQAPPAIGPNQVLDFEVELIEVK
ncbi:MAG: FKBP-type peptidyl-prolyl cis-trans isomerase [Kiritimatiellia bacterium]